MNNLVIAKNKAYVGLILIFITLKLIISPWATGVYTNSLFQLFNLLIDSGILFFAVLGVSLTHAKFRFIYEFALISCLCFVLSSFIYTEHSLIEPLKYHFKIFLPLICLPLLYMVYHQEPSWFLEQVKRMMLLTLTLIILGFLILPNSMNRLEVWWPAYFSGLHTSAYAALATMFICFLLYLHKTVSRRVTILVMCFCSITIFSLWGVRTATLASLIFITGYFSSYYRVGNMSLTWLTLVLVSLFTIILMPFFIASDSFDTFTSGRISMYTDKYYQLMGNDFFNWLIGNGVYSDLIETDIWWWAAKGAHSDIITMLVEGGVIYLGAFITVMYKLYKLGSWLFKCMILAALSTALFSNGIFVRPTAGYLLVLAMVLSFDRNSTRGSSET